MYKGQGNKQQAANNEGSGLKHGKKEMSLERAAGVTGPGGHTEESELYPGACGEPQRDAKFSGLRV